jgi:hypothetical protein
VQQVTNAINDAVTAVKSNTASQGQSSDPTQNTQLAETIANILGDDQPGGVAAVHVRIEPDQREPERGWVVEAALHGARPERYDAVCRGKP